MGDRTAIEWTETTWNPSTGCTRVSAGCDNCYAERLAARLKAMGNPRYAAGFDVVEHWDLIDRPLSWRRPRVVFVNSMSDLFHPSVSSDFIVRVFETMRSTPRHTYQILTKRPKRASLLSSRLAWPTNVWLGVSVEDQSAVWRIDVLREVPAHLRFLSCEPLLGPLELDLSQIGWVIAGGESGPGARVVDPLWITAIRDQCVLAEVPFFFKQWGGRTPKTGGRELDGRLWNGMPSLATGTGTATLG
ncbi:MAG: phage Gp37/Gp68 family protein [Actinobacteria bacterium]|nr:phage Gp37/Gp68 family protein [Actinomycetota bacterium]